MQQTELSFMFVFSQALRTSLQNDEFSSALTYEDHQQKITTYEEAFKRIKECTGISDTMVGALSTWIVYPLVS